MQRPNTSDMITDLWLYGTCHCDGIPFAESSKVGKSVEIISFTNQCCHPCAQKSRAFTYILGVIGSGKNDIEGKMAKAIVKAIIRQASITGKYGVFVKKDGKWYHLRWTINSMVCDNAAQASLSGNGYSGSDKPCAFCKCEKRFCIPFLGITMPRLFGPCMDSMYFKYLPSSHHCTHPHSTTRQPWDAGDLLNNNTDSITRGCYVPWDTNTIPTSIENSIAYQILVCAKAVSTKKKPPDDMMLVNFSSLTSKHIQDCFCIPHEYPATKKDHYSFCLPSPPSSQFSIDAMHSFNNFFNYISSLLHNDLSTKSDRDYNMSVFLKERYPNYTNLPSKFEIPECVNTLAMWRLDNIKTSGGAKWVDRLMVLPKFLDSVNTEKTMTFYLCLFNYAYQDSLDNPVVNLLSRIVSIMSEFYCLNSSYTHAANLQSLLSSYMGQLESIVPPNWRTSATHLPNHLYSILFYHGTLFNINNFNTERSYSEVKTNNTRSRYLLSSLRNREGYKSKCYLLSQPLIRTDVNAIATDKGCEHVIKDENIIRKCLYDDYILSKNPFRINHTFLDDFMESSSKSTVSHSHSNSITYSFNRKMYSKISFCNKTYSAYKGNISKINSLNDLASCSDNICCVKGKKSEVYYFLVEGFCIAEVGKVKYPVAVCHPISTDSLSSECKSFHNSKVLPDWKAKFENVIYISLRRIKMGVVPLWFGNQRILAFTMLKLYIPQYTEIYNDDLIHTLKLMLQ